MTREELKSAVLYHAFQSACIAISEGQCANMKGVPVARVTYEFTLAAMQACMSKISEPEVQKSLKRYSQITEEQFGVFVDMLADSHELSDLTPSGSYHEMSIGVLWEMLKRAISKTETSSLKEVFTEVKGMTPEEILKSSADAAMSLIEFTSETK